MKRFMALFLLFVPLFLYSSPIRFGVDVGSLESCFRESLRVDGECAFSLYDANLIIPIRYGRSADKHLNYLESGLVVRIYPLTDLGLFVEASFLKAGWFWGLMAPEDRLLLSQEGSVGWAIRWGKVNLEPKLTVRNPLSAEVEKTTLLKTIQQFSDMRLSFFVTYEI